MTVNKKSLHILLAEDDADEREFFQEALKSLNRDVTLDIFKNGKELLNELVSYKEASYCPDIIFLDLNMPILNGLEALECIRKIEEFTCVPVIAILTTSSAERDMLMTFERGADAFMSKPSSYQSLVSLIEKVIDMDWATRKRDLGNFIIKL